MNKKVASEIAVGVILILVIVIGGIFWMQNRKMNSITVVSSGDIINTKKQDVSPAISEKDAATQKIDVEIENLRKILVPYDSELAKNTKEKNILMDRLENNIKEASLLATKYPSEARYEWQIGELYRFEHNLDVKVAFENSEKHLDKAIRLDEQYIQPLLSLGFLYVNSRVEYAPIAEEIFTDAKKIASKEDMPAIYNGLSFAYYYQFKWKEALGAINSYLELVPNDESFIKMRDIVKSNIK